MASRKAACGPLNLLREKPCSFSDALFKNSSLGFPRPFKSAASTLHKARRLFVRHFSASFSHACLRFLKGFAFQIPRERETMSVADKKNLICLLVLAMLAFLLYMWQKEKSKLRHKLTSYVSRLRIVYARTVFKNRPKKSHHFFIWQTSQFLIITRKQNVAFEFFNFWHFPSILALLKVICLVTLFDSKFQVFKNSPKWTHFGHFQWTFVLSKSKTSSIHSQRWWHFFCDFQTLCVPQKHLIQRDIFSSIISFLIQPMVAELSWWEDVPWTVVHWPLTRNLFACHIVAPFTSKISTFRCPY